MLIAGPPVTYRDPPETVPCRRAPPRRARVELDPLDARVHFLGRRSALTFRSSGALDVAAMSSDYEGFPAGQRSNACGQTAHPARGHGRRRAARHHRGRPRPACSCRRDAGRALADALIALLSDPARRDRIASRPRSGCPILWSRPRQSGSWRSTTSLLAEVHSSPLHRGSKGALGTFLRLPRLDPRANRHTRAACASRSIATTRIGSSRAPSMPRCRLRCSCSA